MTLHTQPCMFDGSTLTRGAWPFGELAPWSFDLIMADPPWHFALYSEKGEEKSPQAHYATMTLDAIAALPVSELAAEHCLLWLWCTAPMLPAQIAVGERWGFRYVTSGAWVKRTVHDKVAFGTGYVLRNAHEPFVILKRGEPKTAKNVRSVIEAKVREHSRKPDAAFRAAERLMPWPGMRRLELFSRESRKGWASWGNEVGKFDTAAGASAAQSQPCPAADAQAEGAAWASEAARQA